MGILDDEFGGGGTIPTNPTPRPLPPKPLPKPLPETPDIKPGFTDPGLEEFPELENQTVPGGGGVGSGGGGSGGITGEGLGGGNSGEDDSFQLTDDQRFMLIGLVVLGGLFGFIKK